MCYILKFFHIVFSLLNCAAILLCEIVTARIMRMNTKMSTRLMIVSLKYYILSNW